LKESKLQLLMKTVEIATNPLLDKRGAQQRGAGKIQGGIERGHANEKVMFKRGELAATLGCSGAARSDA
jgi:hypothetical protein